MTAREQRRAQVLTRVLAGQWTGEEAAVALGLSIRQARRLKGLWEGGERRLEHLREALGLNAA